MLLLLLALAGLGALGGITVIATRGSMNAAGHDRWKTIALYAAESGAAAGIDYLRRQTEEGVSWSALVSPSNSSPISPSDVVGNGVPNGESGNPFSTDTQAWYEIEILNNETDSGFALGEDRDRRLIIRSTGHGPDGTTAKVEWEVRDNNTGTGGQHCPTYGQRGLAEDGAGRNDCLSTIDATVMESYTPGGN
jgi:hypothetical protein